MEECTCHDDDNDLCFVCSVVLRRTFAKQVHAVMQQRAAASED